MSHRSRKPKRATDIGRAHEPESAHGERASRVPLWFPELEKFIEKRAEAQAGKGGKRLGRIVADRVINKFIKLFERELAPADLKEARNLACKMVRNATIDAKRSRYAVDVDLPAGEVDTRAQDPADLAAEHEAEAESGAGEEERLQWGREHRSELRLGPLQERILGLPLPISDAEAAERLGRTLKDFRRGKARLLRTIARVRASTSGRGLGPEGSGR